MCPEIHQPTALKSKFVDEYVNFIEKTGTKHFGLNIDFGVFQTEGRMQIPGTSNMGRELSRCFTGPPASPVRVAGAHCWNTSARRTPESQKSSIPFIGPQVPADPGNDRRKRTR
jgi:hypothetical protein